MSFYGPSILQAIACAAYFGLMVLHLDQQRATSARFLTQCSCNRLSATAYSVLAIVKSTPFLF